MDKLIDYIKNKYAPLAVIVYGSYADGTRGPDSDFDALVISAEQQVHDTATVDGVALDVFVYPKAYFSGNFNREEFIQIADGRVALDTENRGALLKEQITAYLNGKLPKSEAEIRESLEWCLKMRKRTGRGDAEGMFRWHWLLTESLEIFCDVMHRPYMGPKKTLRWMETEHPEAFLLYRTALQEFSEESLSAWILYLTELD